MIDRMARAKAKESPKPFIPGERKIRLLKKVLAVQRRKRYAAFQAGDGEEALAIERRMLLTQTLIDEWANRTE